MHAFFRHVFLGEHDCELFGAVVAVVEEDHHVAGLDGAVDRGVVDRLDEFVGHVIVVALLHGFDHVAGLFALAVNKKIIGDLDSIPAFVAVHGVVTAYDRSDHAC